MRGWGAAVLAALVSGCAGGPAPLGGQPSFATAQAALASGAPDLALRICRGLLGGLPRNADLLNCQGNALTGLGQNAEAAESFRHALQVEPKSVEAMTGLGRLSLAEQPAAAEAWFLQVLDRQPRSAVALNDLGIARDLQGRHAAAQAAYGEAIAAAPAMRAPQVNLALSLALSGRAAEAGRLARPVAGAADATVQERHVLAAVLGMAGQPAEAARLLEPELPAQQVEQALEGYKALPAR